MIRKLISMAVALALSVACASCSADDESDTVISTGVDSSTTASSEDVATAYVESNEYSLQQSDPVYFSIYENYAWSVTRYVDVVTADGNMYHRDLVKDDISSSRDMFDQVLDFPYNMTSKTKNVYRNVFDEAMEYMNMLPSEDMECEPFNYACDFGTSNLYRVVYDTDGNRSYYKIAAFGDTCMIPEDENAKHVSELLGFNPLMQQADD